MSENIYTPIRMHRSSAPWSVFSCFCVLVALLLSACTSPRQQAAAKAFASDEGILVLRIVNSTDKRWKYHLAAPATRTLPAVLHGYYCASSHLSVRPRSTNAGLTVRARSFAFGKRAALKRHGV